MRKHLPNPMAKYLLAVNPDKPAEGVVDVLELKSTISLSSRTDERTTKASSIDSTVARNRSSLARLGLDHQAPFVTLHRLQREGKVGRKPVEQRHLFIVEEPRL